MAAAEAGAESRERDGATREAEARQAAEADAEFEAALLRLATEIIGLRRDFSQLVDRMGKVGEAGADAARATLRVAANDGVGARERVTAEIGGEVKGLREDLVRTAREHPWRTLGLAAIAGAVVGFLLRR